jgi:hypothetical protein
MAIEREFVEARGQLGKIRGKLAELDEDGTGWEKEVMALDIQMDQLGRKITESQRHQALELFVGAFGECQYDGVAHFDGIIARLTGHFEIGIS